MSSHRPAPVLLLCLLASSACGGEATGAGSEAGGGCDPNPCDSNATCTAYGAEALCDCKRGYEGDGWSCSALASDGCADGQTTCDANATCTASGSASNCVCNPGYAGDGASCRTATGTVSGIFRVNNFGWRTTDGKIGVLLGHAGATVEVRTLADEALVGSVTASSTLATDEDSGDAYATVDFSEITAPGSYYLYIASEDARSYPFTVGDKVYDVVGAAAVKSYYFQRCNHDKVLPYASDALGNFGGLGGQWVDGACHSGDASLAASTLEGFTDDGALDLHGGWHDAGDYQKTLWGRGVPEMLFAYEMNPRVWTDGQLGIPKTVSGLPDLLEEVKWELDFYLRMQRPDGHFITSAKGHGGTVSSPPSASDQERCYFDCTTAGCASPNGSGWSGGGVTALAATGNAVLSLAHAAIVFRSIGYGEIADGYASAASRGWAWLANQEASGGEEKLRVAAASAVFRMDPAQATARTVADGFDWEDWGGRWVTPAEAVLTAGSWHYLMNASGASAVKADIAAAIATLIERAFSQEGAYGGMFGYFGNGWDYSWGSNRTQGLYGSNLFMAAALEVTGARGAQAVRSLAQKHAHYLMGLNPLNMVYMTNMAAYGGEHSSYQVFHGWFSYTGGDGNGNADYNGKPARAIELLYPYYEADTQTSTYGPAPGLVPGGPNAYYSGQYVLSTTCPGGVADCFPAYAYRDFSAAWGTGSAYAWEITEPMQAYQGAAVLLFSFLMKAK